MCQALPFWCIVFLRLLHSSAAQFLSAGPAQGAHRPAKHQNLATGPNDFIRDR